MPEIKTLKLDEPFKEERSEPEIEADRKSDLLAMARRQHWDSITSVQERNCIDHIKNKSFVIGDQWDSEHKDFRDREGLPTISAPLIRALVDKIIGIDQGDMALSLSGVDLKSSQSAEQTFTASSQKDYTLVQIIEGIVKRIESQSNAKGIYNKSRLDQIIGNIGWLKLVVEKSKSSVFENDLAIRVVDDPTKVICDPYVEKPDWSDMRWAFVEREIPFEEFKVKYKDSLASFGFSDNCFHDFYQDVCLVSDNVGNTHRYTRWISEKNNSVTVAEWYLRVPVTKTLHLMSDGRTLDDEGLEQWQRVNAENGIEITPIQSKTIKRWKVEHRLITGWDILEGPYEWVTDEIPLVPMLGKQVSQNGGIVLQSVISQARRIQEYLNWALSTYTRKVSGNLGRMVFMARGQNTEDDFQQQLKRQQAKDTKFIYYDPVPPDGQLDPGRVVPPVVVDATDVGTAELQIMQVFIDQLKEQVGEIQLLASPATSGEQRAIESENEEARFYELRNNRVMAIENLYRKMVKAIPQVYTTEQWQRIITVDDAEDWVKINLANVGQVGETIEGDFSPDFDVRVTGMDSTTSQRRNTRNFISQLVSAQPDFSNVFMLDLIRTLGIADQGKLELTFAMNEITNGRGQALPPELFKKATEKLQETGQLQQIINQQAQQQAQALAQQQVQQLLQDSNAQAVLAQSQATQVKAQSDAARAQITAESAIRKDALQVEQEALQVDQDTLQVQQEALQLDQEEIKLQTALINLQNKGLEANIDQLKLVQEALKEADRVVVGVGGV